jgi:hypothetical protein
MVRRAFIFLGGRIQRDFGAVIDGFANDQDRIPVLRPLRGPFFPNKAHKSLRFIVAGSEGKACRPPGALTDTLRAKMCKP